jgi:diguanylate cyclase (GGDEF)-like protein
VRTTPAVSARARRLDVLRDAYRELLPHRVRRVVISWSGLRGGWSPAALANLESEVRSLAGSAEALGFRAVADAARSMELTLRSASDLPADDLRSAMAKRVEALGEASLLDTDSIRVDLEGPLDTVDQLLPERVQRILFMLSDNGALARDLGLELAYFGYSVRRFESYEVLAAGLAHTPPVAVLIDEADKPDAIRRIRDGCAGNAAGVGLFVISARTDLAIRRQAVRAGVDAFLAKPLDTRSLVDRLDAITLPRQGPYRALVVDCDYSRGLADLLSLQRSGFTGALASGHDDLWPALVELAPEVLLLHHDPPRLDGLEIAGVMRQEELWADLPVIVASETPLHFDDRVLAARFAVDDLQEDESGRERLVALASAHARRERRRRSFLTTDPLTGVMAHPAFMPALVRHVQEARSSAEPLAYVVIDIDSLSSINETFGHLAGNSALRSLGRLLRRRLRGADSVARIAGGEFAVIMPQTTALEARRVMDQVRAMYAGLSHHSPAGELTATCSSGVSELLSSPESAPSLHQRARQALYRARRRGRNRVEIA